MPAAQKLKVRLLLKEALECMQIAATMAACDDAYAATRLREITRALDGLRTHLASDSPTETGAIKRE
jgi:hypothetical protein